MDPATFERYDLACDDTGTDTTTDPVLGSETMGATRASVADGTRDVLDPGW